MLTAIRLNAITYPVELIEREELALVGARLIEIEGQHPDEILAAARNCDALLVVSSRVPGSVIQEFTRCQVISRLGAGTDKIDVESATERGIIVANVPDFCINEQAEHTMALLLASCRQLPYMMDAMQRGRWTARSHPDVHRLAGQTLGLIGFGASAQAVAVRAAAFGMKLLAWARTPDKYAERAAQLGVTLHSVEELLQRSDFVSLHLPLAPDTKGFLDRTRLGMMKPTAVLINTARGALVDELALIEALESNRLRGAGLDVFDGINVFAEPGPQPNHPFYSLENVIMTPHCAGSSVESSLDSKRRGARNAALVLSGQLPPSIVNPEVLSRLRMG
jgi:D-3-phosphoglycerate dehydrogenase